MKNGLLVLAAAMAAALVCQPAAAQKKLRVITTTPGLASIVNSIGGGRVEVKSITRGVQDTHFVEAKPSYAVDLSRADLLVYSGLELEIGWLPLLIQGARNNQVAPGGRGHLNASLAISEEDILEKPRGEVDRTMGDVHPHGNPHYLLDPRLGVKTAQLIQAKLAELDPDSRALYQENLDLFVAQMERDIAAWEARAAGLRGIEIVAYHPHWSYLLNWLGITAAGYIELKPGIPPTPRQKQVIIQTVKERDIKMVVVSSWKNPAAAREVAQAGEVPLVVLPGEVEAMPGADDYRLWMDMMVNELVRAAGTGSGSGHD